MFPYEWLDSLKFEKTNFCTTIPKNVYKQFLKLLKKNNYTTTDDWLCVYNVVDFESFIEGFRKTTEIRLMYGKMQFLSQVYQ